MDTPIYLTHLADVERNSATFAVFTHWTRTVNANQEVRKPSLLIMEKVNADFGALGKKVRLVSNWTDLYSWLGHGSGWAAFSSESAEKLLPHWLSEHTEYECEKISRIGSFKFVDQENLASLSALSIDLQFTDSALSCYYTSNMVLTTQMIIAEL